MQSFERKECDLEWDTSEEESPAKHEYSWEQDNNKAYINQNTRLHIVHLVH